MALITVALLVTSSAGLAPIVTAQADPSPDPSAGAEPDPSTEPTPSPTPEPTPTPTPAPTPWPTPAGIKGLDVSHWNGYPDFGQLSNQGMEFVFSKATQGTSFVDDTYERHTDEARASGLVAGAYHFFNYNQDGLAQAQHFLSTVRETTGLTGLLPLAVDVETLESLGTPNQAQARERLHHLLDELYRRTARYPLIYTSRTMWSRVVGGAQGFAEYPLWVACWKCDTIRLPSGWSDWLFWQVGQFRFNGGVKLDGNVYARGRAGLRRELQRELQLDGGATWSTDRSVQADLRGYDGKDVRYAIGEAAFGPWQPYQRRLDVSLADRQGEQDVHIQLRSFRNVRSLILRESIGLDTEPPAIAGPKIWIRSGSRMPRSGARVPVGSKVTARDRGAGLRSSSLAVKCGGVKRAVKHDQAPTVRVLVNLDRRGCSIKARSDDVFGHRAARKLEPRIKLRDVRKNSRSVVLRGDWQVLSRANALGGTLARAGSGRASVTLTFSGAQFAVIARRGPSGGRLKVVVDGKRVDSIDLYHGTRDDRRVVYVRNVPRGTHTVRLVSVGGGADDSPAAVWLDAFLVLDRRK